MDDVNTDAQSEMSLILQSSFDGIIITSSFESTQTLYLLQKYIIAWHECQRSII